MLPEEFVEVSKDGLSYSKSRKGHRTLHGSGRHPHLREEMKDIIEYER